MSSFAEQNRNQDKNQENSDQCGFSRCFYNISFCLFLFAEECFLFIDSIRRLWWFDWWCEANWIHERHSYDRKGITANRQIGGGIEEARWRKRNFFHYS